MSRIIRLYRWIISSTTISTMLFSTLVIITVISIINVFSHPFPFQPKTSTGILTILSFILIPLTYLYVRQNRINIRNKFSLFVDIIILLFLISSALSLIFSDSINDMIPHRMFLIATVVYFVSHIYIPTDGQKRIFIHIIGLITVAIALCSVLFLVFPAMMNDIAFRFFSGKDTYGLIVDFNRGRLLHWGSIILCYPFFFASALLLSKRRFFSLYLYIFIGFLILTLSMIISNFRWLLFCYFIGLAIFTRLCISYNILKFRSALYLVFVLVFTIVIGLTGAKLAFNYNIIDRLLLTNSHRDIDETLGRFYLYKQSIDLYLSNLGSGIGIGNYIYNTEPFELHLYYNKYTDIFQVLLAPLAAHNEFLSVLAEIGTFGFIAFLLIIYFTLKRLTILLFQSYRNLNQTDLLLTLSLFVSYVSFILYILFENIFPHNYLYLFLLTGIAYTWILNKKTTETS